MRAAVIVTALLLAGARQGDPLTRFDEYLERYEARLANVVAEETYRQWVEPGPATPGATRTRTLRSDFALTATGRNRWVGYRDTFEVDGAPVRDREARLQRLLSTGAVAQAARVAEQNARFNLGDDLISRNVNVPTLAVELMGPRFRDRFRVRRTGTEVLDGRPGWLFEFRERERPTIVRTPEGRDRISRIVALVDLQTGELRRTVLTWDDVEGSVGVFYGEAASLPVAVPIRMTERYVTRTGAVVAGEATYANYRQFTTSARILR